MGMLGLPAPHAVFGPMVAASEEAISLGNPGVTDALEFNDGKIMVNKSHHFKVSGGVGGSLRLERCGPRAGSCLPSTHRVNLLGSGL